MRWSKRRGLAQGCAFWELKNLKLIFNVFIPKIPKHYNGAYGENQTILKTVITLAVYKSRNFWFYGMIFGDSQSNGVIKFYPGSSLVAMATKFETKLAITCIV